MRGVCHQLILSRPSVSSIETSQGSTIIAVAMLFMFTITVTDTQGSEVDWTLESQPLATLTSYGWAESTMKLGDKVTAIGYPARNGKPAMLVRAIQLPDGRTIDRKSVV